MSHWSAIVCQAFSPDGFTRRGSDLPKKRIIVVKSTNHFYAGFTPIAGDPLYASAPTAMPSDLLPSPTATSTGLIGRVPPIRSATGQQLTARNYLEVGHE
jgi:microcystin degradation protein MlrC